MKKTKVVVVMPAYNAEQTLEKTYKDIPKRKVDEIILVDDKSNDNTVKKAKELKIKTFSHKKNKGYGGNQKTCYKKALKEGADIIVMLHPDYQYDPKLIGEMIEPIKKNKYDIILGNRIRSRKEAFEGGMPKTKYFLNRMLTFIENVVLGTNLREHLSGYRAYTKEVLKTLPLKKMSDDFVFDQQFTISATYSGFDIGHIEVPVRYFDEASSIQFIRGTKFMLQTFWTLFLFTLAKNGIYKAKVFK